MIYALAVISSATGMICLVQGDPDATAFIVGSGLLLALARILDAIKDKSA